MTGPVLPKGWTLQKSYPNNYQVKLYAVSPDGRTTVYTSPVNLYKIPGDFGTDLADAFEKLCHDVANVRANQKSLQKLIDLWKDN